MSKSFADRLTAQIQRTGSILCVGFDPSIPALPRYVLEKLQGQTISPEVIDDTLFSFYSIFIERLSNSIACIKPNIAFFEQYGLGGLSAINKLCRLAQEVGLPIILDGKRGDIGSTAEAYAHAYLGSNDKDPFIQQVAEVDALTINPFLGFDTLDPFVKMAQSNNKGLFILVRTSNPGASVIQGDFKNHQGVSITQYLAQWIGDNSALQGSSGLSGLGAVVGATQPIEAVALRGLMPNAYFLVPGFGAQGASAAEAVAGKRHDGSGLVVNVSRAMTSGLADLPQIKLGDEITKRAETLSKQLSEAL